MKKKKTNLSNKVNRSNASVDLITFGAETLTVAAYFLVKSPFRDDPHAHMVHLTFFALGNPYYCLLMLIIGMLAITAGITDDQPRAPIVVLLSVIWSINSAAFYIQDTHFGRMISLSTLLALFVLVRILVYARLGRWLQ